VDPVEPVEPVEDRASGYDIFDPAFAAHPLAVLGDLRERGSVARSEHWGGSWLPLRYTDVFAIAHDPVRYSSTDVYVVPVPLPHDELGRRKRSILFTDPPLHAEERRLILPFFAPPKIEDFAASTRDLCNRLIDGFIDDGVVDASTRYAKQIPPRIIAAILGVDAERADEFASWVDASLDLSNPPRRAEHRQIILDFFRDEIARRADQPGTDLISWLLRQEIDGQPFAMHLLEENLMLMLAAGVDTTWGAIGFALWHLASHPEDVAALKAEPALLDTAVEELLRASSPVTMARIVQENTEMAGCLLQRGDRVLLSFMAANHDPSVFDQPERIDLRRTPNRHIAFGTGIHRCAGSNLARMELRVALSTWIERIPSFRLAEPEDVTWSNGQVRVLKRLALAIG
jgi:hypothetical protein